MYNILTGFLGRTDLTQQLNTYGNVELLENEFEDCSMLPRIIRTDEEPGCSTQGNYSSLAADGIEYVAGYYTKKLNLEIKDDICPETWVAEVSEGGLCIPSDANVNAVRELDSVFNTLNNLKLGFSDKPGLLKRLLDNANHITACETLKKRFFKFRIYHRINYYNRHIVPNEQTRKIKRKMNKTIH